MLSSAATSWHGGKATNSSWLLPPLPPISPARKRANIGIPMEMQANPGKNLKANLLASNYYGDVNSHHFLHISHHCIDLTFQLSTPSMLENMHPQPYLRAARNSETHFYHQQVQMFQKKTSKKQLWQEKGRLDIRGQLALRWQKPHILQQWKLSSRPWGWWLRLKGTSQHPRPIARNSPEIYPFPYFSPPKKTPTIFQRIWMNNPSQGPIIRTFPSEARRSPLLVNIWDFQKRFQ